MAEMLFALDRANIRECQNLYRGPREQEYYSGDFWVEDTGNIDIKSEREMVGPVSIIRQKSAANLFFRRTRQHIRDDATDLAILWFVRRGQLVFSNQFGSKTACSADFAITRSMSPFLIECRPDGSGYHEITHVTIPTHILRAYIPCDFSTGLFVPAQRPEFGIARNILNDVFKENSRLDAESSRTLVDAALVLLGKAIGQDNVATGQARQSIAEERLEDVLRFIEVHLSDPHLSTSMVAKGCGISQRYLSFLLRLRGTSFSELVWGQRLENARDWLSNSMAQDVSISEVAYGVGFKSPAHFSRMFKRFFKTSPREYRNHLCQSNLRMPQAGVEDDAVPPPVVQANRRAFTLQ